MKYRKLIIFINLLVFLILFTNIDVNADMGPTPQTIIEIVGIEGDYVAAFASRKVQGPNFDYEMWKEELNYYIEYNSIMEYEDEEGFKWITSYYICNGDTKIRFNYYRPEEFKIVIYKDNRLYKVSDIINCYAFTSKFEINFNNTITIKNTYPYFKEIVFLLIRIVLTLCIEIGIFFLFRLYTKRNFLIIGITNIITQLILNIVVNTKLYLYGSLTAIFDLIIMEIFIMIIEPIIYIILLRNKNKFVILLYGILSNIVSFILGVILTTYVLV